MRKTVGTEQYGFENSMRRRTSIPRSRMCAVHQCKDAELVPVSVHVRALGPRTLIIRVNLGLQTH